MIQQPTTILAWFAVSPRSLTFKSNHLRFIVLSWQSNYCSLTCVHGSLPRLHPYSSAKHHHNILVSTCCVCLMDYCKVVKKLLPRQRTQPCLLRLRFGSFILDFHRFHSSTHLFTCRVLFYSFNGYRIKLLFTHLCTHLYIYIHRHSLTIHRVTYIHFIYNSIEESRLRRRGKQTGFVSQDSVQEASETECEEMVKG